jgi:hypothetical protein
VNRLTGKAAPSSAVHPLGRTRTADWVDTTYSEKAPLFSSWVPWTDVATRSPTLTCLTADPTATTSPAESQPTTEKAMGKRRVR